MSTKGAEWVALAFFGALVVLVFQQIATSMSEQGIASGGPYDNAASYPRNVAIFMMGLLAVQLVRASFVNSEPQSEPPTAAGFRRGVGLLLIFALYLACLNWLGYHLSTTPMAATVMWLCGLRNIGKALGVALVMAFSLAFAFEKILNVVLPGGVLGLNIPW
ncbi:MAG: tripartite tricarboxylate transporter TctB family protein [Pseudomonadota bacterium]